MLQLRYNLVLSVLMPILGMPLQAWSEPSSDWRQALEYRISARLDAPAKKITATQSIRYTNASPDTLQQLVLHLYPNAFRDEDSPMRRLHWQDFNGRLVDELGPADRGWIDIDSLRVDGHDAAFDIDYTLMRVPLEPPLLPGQATELELAWQGQIRKYRTRSGWRGAQFDMAQWYPKVAMYDTKGWDSEVYSRGEFYGNFASFDVRLDVPADHVVAATGELTSGDAGWAEARARMQGESLELDAEARRSLRFQAERVHDFAWCASPQFALVDTTWNEIPIHSFFSVDDEPDWADSMHVYGARALAWLDELVGPYPYPQMTLVHGLQGGGMEYPMLVMNGRASESLVVHEVGHIYFYGILANDETGQAWLDEGFTTWQTQRYLVERYGHQGKRDRLSWFQRLLDREGAWEKTRRSQAARARRGRVEPIDTHSHAFVEAYGAMVYGRASLFLEHLENLLGGEIFDRGLQLYYERWALDHVTEERFREALEEVSGQKLKPVFDAWLRGTDMIDFAIDEVRAEKQEDCTWQSQVTVERVGDVPAPLKLRIEGGRGAAGEADRNEPLLVERSGTPRVIEIEVATNERPKRYALDPEQLTSDADRRNDRWPRATRLAIDWPGFNEPTEDAYTLRVRPGGWHNDIDGLRVGGNLRLGYGGWFDQALVGLWWSEKRERFDYRLRMARPSRRLRRWGRDGQQSFAIEDVEGLKSWSWRFERWGSRQVIAPPHHHFGFELQRLSVGERLAGSGWETGDTHVFGVFYDVSPRVFPLEFYGSLRFRHGFELFAGDHPFDKIALRGTIDGHWPRTNIHMQLGLFSGLSVDSTPAHERFHVAGAGALARHAAPWLSSPGALPNDFHAWLPGEGNVRGYFGTGLDFSAQRLVALNAQLSTPIPLVGGQVNWLVRDARLNLFADLASAGGQGVPLPQLGSLRDAGVGIEGKLFGVLPLRLDLPLWLSHPQLIGDQREVEFRWLLSMQAPWSAALIQRSP